MVELHGSRLATLYAHQNPAGMEPSALKTPPLFYTADSIPATRHGESLPRRCERSILIGIVGFQARQSNRPRGSSAGGARLSGNALVSLVSALCFR